MTTPSPHHHLTPVRIYVIVWIALLIATVLNQGGFYTNHIGRNGRGTYMYRLCEAGTANCSNQVTVTFGGGH